MGSVDASFSADGLVALLTEAGELAAGAEALAAMEARAHGVAAARVERLREGLRRAVGPDPVHRHAALRRLRDGWIDALLRQGALREACAALGALDRAFPSETAWAARRRHVQDLLTPLARPEAAHADALVAQGRIREAWEVFRALAAVEPDEPSFARRAAMLRALIVEPMPTIHSRESAPRPAAEHPREVFARSQEDVARGELRSAWRRVAGASPGPSYAVRWIRYRDALLELCRIAEQEEGAPEVRGSAVDRVDRRIRAGALTDARDEARRCLAARLDVREGTLLAQRLNTLDEALGDALRTAMANAPSAPPPGDAPGIEVSIVRDPPGLEVVDDEPTTRRAALPPRDG